LGKFGSKNIISKLPSYKNVTDRGRKGRDSSTERLMGVMGGGMGFVRQASASKIRPGSKGLNFQGSQRKNGFGKDFVIDCRNL
jgi:hypothetical protein